MFVNLLGKEIGKKVACEMLVSLDKGQPPFVAHIQTEMLLSGRIPAPGVNFINILRAAFALVDPESIKRYL